MQISLSGYDQVGSENSVDRFVDYNRILVRFLWILLWIPNLHVKMLSDHNPVAFADTFMDTFLWDSIRL